MLSIKDLKWTSLLRGAVCICAVFLALSATPQKTTTKFDEKYDFSLHRRYKWRANRLVTRQHPDTNEEMDLKITKAVNRLLRAKGFVETQEKPDFCIYYDGGGDTQVGPGGPSQANSGPTSPSDPTPTYGLGNGPALSPTNWLKVNGQIEFYLVDADSQRAVWKTVYRKTFHDPDKALRNMDKELNELVSKSFKNFPPK